MLLEDLAVERRKKARFPMNRDLRYKVLEGDTVVELGTGTTLDMGSGGVSFLTQNQLPTGSFIELSISWPVLLEDSCPMRLIVFGRVVRNAGRLTACTVGQIRIPDPGPGAPHDAPGAQRFHVATLGRQYPQRNREGRHCLTASPPVAVDSEELAAPTS